MIMYFFPGKLLFDNFMVISDNFFYAIFEAKYLKQSHNKQSTRAITKQKKKAREMHQLLLFPLQSNQIFYPSKKKKKPNLLLL